MIAIDRIERLPWPWVDRHGLTVRWFDRWTAVLDEALKELPDAADCPHELLAALMRNRSGARKCAALITKGDQPVALIGLRRIGMARWDLVGGGGVAPRFLAHAVDGYLFPALSALGLNIHVSTQRQQPPERWVRRAVEHPAFQIALTSDYEAYWKEHSQLTGVREARKRSKDLICEIDGPGAAEWTIRKWADRWRSTATVSQDDLVIAADYFEQAGRFHTIRMLDGREPVSGWTWLTEDAGLLAISTFTDPAYRRHRAGLRGLDLSCEWAAREGFHHLDLGVMHDYKKRLGPQSGTRWSFDVRPWHLHVAADVVRRGVAVGRATMKAARMALGVGGSASLETSPELPASPTTTSVGAAGGHYGD